MEELQGIITVVMQFLQLEMTIYGFTFSWWDVLLWTMIAGICLAFVGRLFDGK